ncbi:MAG: hypothetical protein C4523_08515 [Myxococcales bacterium]|nr:MAG: hypothetical protein C4523_08515 [Myxococcales bacterium]
MRQASIAIGLTIIALLLWAPGCSRCAGQEATSFTCPPGQTRASDGACVPILSKSAPANAPLAAQPLTPAAKQAAARAAGLADDNEPSPGRLCEGQYCAADEDCCEGAHCHLATHTCGFVCSTDRHCGARCCDKKRGRCEPCPPPLDGDADAEKGPPEDCPERKDEECAAGYYCNPFAKCEQGECSAAQPCPTGFACNEHGRCRPLPSDSVAPSAPKACRRQADCPAGQVCDWRRFECLPGCQGDVECPPETPRCIEGVCR